MEINKVMQKNSMWFLIKDHLFIILGSFIYAFAWAGFLIPNKLTIGGAPGIGSILYYAFGFPDINVTYAVINVVLLLLALKILGKKFCLRTIFGVFFCWLFLFLLPKFIDHAIVENQPFMSAIIGGILCGVGVGMVFISNGSTGGTDIVAAIVNKYRNITFGRMYLYTDAIIISSSYFVYHSVEKVIYGYIILCIMTYVCDMVINGIRASVQLLIFSDKWEELANHINEDLHRGVTVLDGMGWYSKKPRKVLVVLVKRTEANSLNRMIKMIDPQAFISQSSVLGVYGQGFDKIK
jgi:uncharacterized membrane-anchored protein YitT (DUF2179 family)